MELIIDRTQTDVLLGTKKGCYGVEDLNRVEQVVKELAELLKSLDIQYLPEVKLDWALPGAFDPEHWPVQSHMQRYLGNVHTLCALLEVQIQLPQSMNQLTWHGANQIEEALTNVQKQIQSVLETFQFSGELIAGEE